MAKKKKCPEEAGEKWLVAYADMMTLLFALFVVLYSITNVEIEKLKAVKKSFQRAFGMSSEEVQDADGFPSGNSRTEGIFNKVRGTSTRDSMSSKNRRELAAIIAADAKTIERTIIDKFQGSKEFPAVGGKADDRVVYFNRDADGIRITLLARGFFSPSQVVIEPEGGRVLDGIAQAIKGVGKVVRIEGHTDNRPFYKNDPVLDTGITNWELSTLRASAVVRYFIDKHNFPPEMLYAAGYGDTRPIAINDTPERRSMNRRVDIKVLYDNPSEYTAPDILPKAEGGEPKTERKEESPPAEPPAGKNSEGGAQH